MKTNKFLAIPLVAAVFALGTVGVASAQVAGPRVALQFATNGLTSPLSASGSNSVIARLLLDTTGSSESVRLNSLPFNLVLGSGALASTLKNCRVYNEADTSTALNTPASISTTLQEGMNNITFNSPMILAANSMTTLSLRCDVDSNIVSGGTYTINMNTNNVVATGASTGLAAAVTIRGSVVVPPVYTYPTPTTPGMPVTGATGEATQNLAMIAASILVAALGFSYLSVQKRQS